MGAIGGMLGLSGGASGSGYAKPELAPIAPGTNPAQLQTAYGGAQNSLQSQQALLQALQAQNGLGNQSAVYNQLQGVANGTGPNPAQAMLNQQTGANVANQAALMAGQRGAGANPALIARQAAQQGAAIQQNAIGQGATMQANQQLGALGAMGNLANIQAGQQIGATTANTQAQQSEQQILQNAIAQSNTANVANQSSVNTANAGLAGKNMDAQKDMIGGVMNGAGSAAAMLAQGGTVQGYDMGGAVSQAPTLGVDTNLGPSSSFGNFLKGWSNGAPTPLAAPVQQQAAPMTSDAALQQGTSNFITGIAKGLGAGGAGAGAAVAASQGGNVGSQLKSGGHVPGKAKVAGNSYSNDTVKAVLSPGELVVDRETMNDKGQAGQAARFLSAVIAAKKKGGK